MKVAARTWRRDTFFMAVPNQRGPLLLAAVALAISTIGASARADEIRLKDGKKLYGVIVAYEDNMFRVKTDFGFVLVEKDKIASIIPTAPSGAKSDAPPAAKKKSSASDKNGPTTEPAVASGGAAPDAMNASARSEPVELAKRERPSARISNAAI